MTDNAKVVLRWEIDNATAKLATGKAESGVFNEGGFKWAIEMNERVVTTENSTDFTLRCDTDDGKGPWKCEVEVDINLIHRSTVNFDVCDKQHFCFDENTRSWLYQSPLLWKTMKHEYYKVNDKVTIEFQICIISFEKFVATPIPESTMFDAPNNRSDVILKFGEKKLHVSKEMLAIHSPFFETLFFGKFAENGEDEVEIKDVLYEEFVDLLNLIYIGTLKITDGTVLHLLKLADKFQMERVLDQCNLYLIESTEFDVMKKLLLADQYRLDSLRDHCLQSFNSTAELIEKIKSSPNFDNFSDGMKAAVCDRIKNL